LARQLTEVEAEVRLADAGDILPEQSGRGKRRC
jgi:hypothetical protein